MSVPAPVFTRLTAPALSAISEAMVKATPVLFWVMKSSACCERRTPPVKPEAATPTAGVTSKPPDCRPNGPAKVKVLAGGFPAWKAAGLPTVTIDIETGAVRDPR
mgnify:CR=1 FL=1